MDDATPSGRAAVASDGAPNGTPGDAGGSLRRLALPAVTLTVALAVAALTASGLARTWDLPLRDSFLRLGSRRQVERVAAVTIDEESLKALGPWPWPRQRLAAVVQAARDAGAKLVVVDLLLAEPAAGDPELVTAVAAGPTILITALTDDGLGWVLPTAGLEDGATLAHAGFPLDHDGVLRRFSTTQQAGGRSYPAVAVATDALLSGRAMDVARSVVPDFRARASEVPRVAAATLLAGAAPPEMLRGRAVFVGATALGLGDRVVTPTSPRDRPEPGVTVHAAVTEGVLSGHLLHPAGPAVAGVLAGLIVLLVAALARLGGAARAAAEIGLATLLPVGAAAALLATGVELPAGTLTLTTILAIATVEARLSWLTWRRAGTAATLLAEPGTGSRLPSAPAARLADLEGLARSARRRREDDAEARRVLAHELKTPLTSMRGMAQLLAEFDLPPDEQRRVAAMVGGEVDRLREMVDGILEIARLGERPRSEAGRVDLAALTRERCLSLATGSGRAVECRAPSPALVAGDPGLLGRVLDNLVGNAIKYSDPPSAVEVGVAVDGDRVVVSVTDRGRGIPAAELETVFGRFVRGSSAAGTSGTGLGLALVREVVTWHGGRVEVESAQGAGSTFRVVLPPWSGRSGG